MGVLNLVSFPHVKNYMIMRLLQLLLLASILTFVSCSDDDAEFDPYVLHYDGENNNSPPLPPGEYEAAAHFATSDLTDYFDKELVAIELYIYNRPDSGSVVISESAGPGSPGNIIQSYDIKDDIDPFSWNRVELTSPLPLDDGLWLSFYFENSINNYQIMGCDAGPRDANGDWLFDSQDSPQWRTYADRTGESINWNIRGILQDR